MGDSEGAEKGTLGAGGAEGAQAAPAGPSPQGPTSHMGSVTDMGWTFIVV